MRNLNLTPRAQKLIKEAHNLASQAKHKKINHLHLLVSFFILKYNQISEAFDYFEIDIEEYRAVVAKVLDKNIKEREGEPPENQPKPTLSLKTKNLFKNAKSLSAKYDHKYIGLEHIFLSLFEDPDVYLLELINAVDICYDKIVDYVEKKLEEDDLIPSSMQDNEEEEQSSHFDPRKYKLLNSYATNLNLQIIQGKISPLHINERLIKRTSEVLCRKNKNNPLIVGEAGIGKTALVESLAQAITEGKCSDFLVMKNIYSLDVPMIIAGCKYRGEFEEKIKNLLKEVIDDPHIILFIDEIHTIIGAGNPENGMDVANILKPYLARGEITCIGATTYDEYKRTIANDPALSRRFQMVKMEEPSKQEVSDLIKNIKCFYEEYHLIKITDSLINFVIEVSDKYIEGRFPDKALDVLDQVGAKVKLKNFTKNPEMLKLETKMKDLVENQSKMFEKDFQNKMQRVIKKYQAAAENLINCWKESRYKIKDSDILEVVSDKTNIPISDLKKQDGQKIKLLKKSLEKELIGQKEPIDQIYKCLLRSKAGFRDLNKPIASMLFAGPTGVGKTLSAKIIADNLFVSQNNFVSLDLSEYTDQTSVNKLIGSSPGYVGYGKGGMLIEKISRNPYSLILFDEIQKAHKDVLFVLLQILEEGKLSDSSGKVVDFSNTVIIMTTNVGAENMTHTNIGFTKDQSDPKSEAMNALKKYFPPDLLNRIDEVIPFHLLNEEEIKSIISKELSNFKNTLKERGINISISKTIINFVFKKIQFDNFGARQVLKTVQRELQTLVAEFILDNAKAKNLKISIKQDKICVI